MSARVELRHGIYRDSVVLMQVSQAVASCRGVTAAIVAMATPLNIEIYERLGFDLAAVAGATPNDLLVAVEGDQAARGSGGRARATAGAAGGAGDPRIRICPASPDTRFGTQARRLAGPDLGAR